MFISYCVENFIESNYYKEKVVMSFIPRLIELLEYN
jgi:hypothetical protein